MSKVYLEPYEEESLERAAARLRDRLLIRVPYRSGCRISEALGIAVPDIDFQQGTITIQHLKTRLKLACPRCNAGLGRNNVFCPKCGVRVEEAVARAKEHQRVRTLSLDSGTLEMLRQHIDSGGIVIKEGRQLIFSINRHRAWQIVRDCAKRAGLGPLVNPDTGRTRGVSPHRLRDAFAVMAVKADDSGDGLRLLQEHLGHASFNTTAKYRKVAGEEQRDWYNKLWSGKQTDQR